MLHFGVMVEFEKCSSNVYESCPVLTNLIELERLCLRDGRWGGPTDCMEDKAMVRWCIGIPLCVRRNHHIPRYGNAILIFVGGLMQRRRSSLCDSKEKVVGRKMTIEPCSVKKDPLSGVFDQWMSSSTLSIR